MTDSPFIHLAVRSSYSLLESMITPADIADWAVEHAMPALAVSDHNNLFGALELSELLSGRGVQPVMACCFDLLGPGPRDFLNDGCKRPAEKANRVCAFYFLKSRPAKSPARRHFSMWSK